MSYNGWSNWATWEAYNWFGDNFDILCAEVTETSTDADSAREAFCDSAASLVEDAIDNDLRVNGLSGNLVALASDFIEDNINFGEIFDAFLADNPSVFGNDEDDEDDEDD